jgi:predicted amidohydrolase YtcJ
MACFKINILHKNFLLNNNHLNQSFRVVMEITYKSLSLFKLVVLFLVTVILFTIGQPVYAQNQAWNLVLDAPMAASGFTQGNPPENLINANAPVCWSVEGGGMQWLEINFGDPAVLQRFELTIGHDYKGEPVNMYGRFAGGEYKLLHHFQNEQLIGDSSIVFEPSQPWDNVEFIRLESPESPLTLCWRHLGLIGYIPGQIPPDDIDDFCRPAPDLIYYNGTVITMDPATPVAEAVAIHTNTITGVGTNEEIMNMRIAGCRTELIDLNGLTVLPGFNDSHCHWISWRRHICEPAGDTTYPSYEEIMRNLSLNGWTSISELNFGRPDDGSADHYYDVMDMALRGTLPVRLNGYWGTLNDGTDLIDVLSDSSRTPERAYSERVRAPGVKIYIDDPFGTTDILSQTDVNNLVQYAYNAGWQVAAHAVNESAVEKILSAYEMALGADMNDIRRLRIEHAVKVSDDQMNRMLNKRIIASVQLMGPPDWPAQETFQTYISNTHPEYCLRWRDFANEGMQMTGSTDAPFNNSVCDYSPFRVMYQGISRIGYLDHIHADWELNQRLTIQQALELMTIDGAYATFEEDRKGSITSGKWADLVIVSDNPLEIADPEDLLNIRVLQTMVGGRIEFCDDAAYPNLCGRYTTFSISGALVSASSYLTDQTPDMAFDGNSATGWSSGNYAPQWIQIDLLHNARINGIDLTVDQWPAGYTQHQVLAKNNYSGDYTHLHQFSGNTETDDVLRYIAPLPADSFRFIKILTTVSPSWVAWKDIRIYQNSDLPDATESFTDQSVDDIKIAPLPLNELTSLSYNLNMPGVLSIRLIGADGRQICSLLNEYEQSGDHSRNLLRMIHDPIAPGIYFISISTSSISIVKKIPFLF